MAGEEPTAREAPAFLIDLKSHEVTLMTKLTFGQAGLGERKDLQRWVTEHPELIATPL